MAKPKIKPFAFFFNTEGVDEDAGEFYIQPDAAELIENMHMDTIGQWSTHNQGYDNFTSQLESGAKFDSLYCYTDASGNNYLIGAINGKVKNINVTTGAVTSEISTGFTAGNKVDFETFKGTLYAAEKSLTPQKWSGSGSMSTVSNIPLTTGGDTYDKPALIEKYANRLVYGNFNGATRFPSHILLSDDLAPETFTIGSAATNAAIIQISPGDGQELRGMRSLPIPASNSAVLVLFKDKSIYALEGTTPETFQLYLVNPEIGALNNNCIIQVGTDILFLDINNIYSLTTANESGTIQPKAIGSDKIRDTLNDLNLSAKDNAWTKHIPHRREVWFAIPTGSNTNPDTILVYRYGQGKGGAVNAWSVRKGTTETCAALVNKTFFTGCSTGYVRKWFANTEYGSTGVGWRYRYPWFNFGTQAQNKRIVDCDLWFLLLGDQTITIRTEWRGGGNNTVKSISKPISISSGAGSVYGSSAPPAAVYGTSLYGDGAILKKVKFPVLGNGEQFRLTVSGTAGETGPVFLGASGWVDYLGPSRSYK